MRTACKFQANPNRTALGGTKDFQLYFYFYFLDNSIGFPDFLTGQLASGHKLSASFYFNNRFALTALPQERAIPETNSAHY